MKQPILSFLILLTTFPAKALRVAPKLSANYQAANWKTCLLDNTQQIKVIAPPNNADSKRELEFIKRQLKIFGKRNQAICCGNPDEKTGS